MTDDAQHERRGLVLGGGGVTGIAWMTGLLTGLAEHGVDLTDADRVVGTSAGSVVGAQVTTGVPLPDLYARQVRDPDPALPVDTIGAQVLLGFAWSMLRARGDVEAFGRLLGSWAVRRAEAGRTPTLEERYAAIGERLPVRNWGEPGRLRVTAVDARTGELRVFDGTDGTDGVSLLDAVAASCAVPGIFPPVPIGSETYIDGGARSTANADLAVDCDRVVALVPIPRSVGPMASPRAQLGDRSAVVVTPDADSRAAIGRNVLDHRARPGSARAGHAQSAAVADRVRDLWVSGG